MSLALIVVQIAHFAELVLTLLLLLLLLLRSIGFRVRVRVWFLSLRFFLHCRTEASLSERLVNFEKEKRNSSKKRKRIGSRSFGIRVRVGKYGFGSLKRFCAKM